MTEVQELEKKLKEARERETKNGGLELREYFAELNEKFSGKYIVSGTLGWNANLIVYRLDEIKSYENYSGISGFNLITGEYYNITGVPKYSTSSAKNLKGFNLAGVSFIKNLGNVTAVGVVAGKIDGTKLTAYTANFMPNSIYGAKNAWNSFEERIVEIEPEAYEMIARRFEEQAIQNKHLWENIKELIKK